MIHEELGDAKARIALCGVAGENGVLFASIMHDINRAAARNGLGAVMGSKQLKALAVRGTQALPVADRAPCCRCRNGWAKTTASFRAGRFRWAPGQRGLPQRDRGLPTRNFQDPSFPDAERISGKTMQKTILRERDTCQACPIRCKQVVEYTRQGAEEKLGEWQDAGLVEPTPASSAWKLSTADRSMRHWPRSGAAAGSAIW